MENIIFHVSNVNTRNNSQKPEQNFHVLIFAKC